MLNKEDERHSAQSIYVIVVNWNGLEDTKNCIESLKLVDGYKLKIIVVDNGSKNNDAKKLLHLNNDIKIIQNKKNFGFCKANNQAIDYALAQDDCGYIMILNNDTTVSSDFLKPLIEKVESEKCVVGPKILFLHDKTRIQTLGGQNIGGLIRHIGKNKSSKSFQRIVVPDSLSGACFISKKEAFREIGGFDEKFFAYLEDVDWSWRAKKAGFKLYTVTNSIIYHKHSASTKTNKNKQAFKLYLLGRNHIYLYRKNLNILNCTLYTFNYLFFISPLYLLLNNYSFFGVKRFYKGIMHGFINRWVS